MHGYSILCSSTSNVFTIYPNGMWLVSASASGFAWDEGTPRNGGRGGQPAGGGNASPDDHRADDLGQEEILDLVVEAMLARGGPPPEDDEPADDDGYADSLWETREAPGPQDTDEQDSGPGAGFGSDQPLDALRPGPALAGAADRVHTGALRRVSDDELTGMIKAWRRLSSWATARELGAIAEFARRCPEEDTESDFARYVKARRAASGPPQAATQAGPAQRPGRATPSGSGCPSRRNCRGTPSGSDRPSRRNVRGWRGKPGSSGCCGCAGWRSNRLSRRSCAAASAGGGPARNRVFRR